MKIAIDGMGGDNAPKAVVEGVILALKEYDGIEYYITGKAEEIEEELKKYKYDEKLVKVIDAREVISPNEHPVMALKRKKDSSICKALKLVKDKECDAVISGGSTGAFLAGCTLLVGRIKGVERPALAPIMPGKNGSFMIVDAGANVDSKPSYLVQFAHMGKIYYQEVLGKKNPSVGLVNIGAEEEKGNELTKAAHKLLKEEENLNFVGNVEPRETSSGDVNVLVCDGFVGNTLLKMYEGVAKTLLSMIKEEILSSGIKSKIGAALLGPVFKKLKIKFDYKEYGGAPFLGVEGICIKAHGSSDSKAFKNAIRQTKTFYDNEVLEKIKQELKNNI
ncbi:phosphate acyltransferase PlsX [Clostridium chauvoei]|uniref:Phosphate acyltransferase n=2 Tax=Clostridium chauvoei TaxID=46867 RepID=S6FLT7_9CLOT|nr:phosphate acyltransferase PlsX [Clostridium chauvoei]ATD54937.1 phosphate--acyl-ACP acyltransferase [Clostridium chauvoei]ATD57384.1 phosphate--acyl-ACP acyltransferase [Clostridium chauvoei]MBX7280448.1 phosphate acyltransferase PlsX [Clostridium chauvoei]MBX7282933.1 phosphate acyltransferase PlsX [Clostridium chauvoei]MBX7285450.1 phosphate acyltransferase PlsX [Clostridium chauvoei]